MLRRQPLMKKGGLRSSKTAPTYSQKMNSLKTENMNKGYNMLLNMRADIGAEESKSRKMPDIPRPPIKTNAPTPTPPPRDNIRKFKRKRVRKSYAGTGKDITTHVENKTEHQLKVEEEKDELDAVDEKVLQEAMRPRRAGEDLYNKLVKKKKKKSIPKSVRARIKKMKQIRAENPPPINVLEAINDM